MEQFLIEQAKPEDAALLLDYMKSIGGETDNLSFGAEDIHINADGKAKQLAAQQQSKDNVLFVAKAAGTIIGDASLERMPRRMNHRGEFGIAVRKTWWGCGVASALMKEILKFAKANGFEQLNLEVRSDNTRAIRLYYELDENGTATDNLLFLSESEMRLNKSGSIAGQFLFTPYTKTVAGYLTPFGKIVFGVETESYHLDAKEDFLDAQLKYRLYTGDQLFSENTLTIHICNADLVNE